MYWLIANGISTHLNCFFTRRKDGVVVLPAAIQYVFYSCSIIQFGLQLRLLTSEVRLLFDAYHVSFAEISQ